MAQVTERPLIDRLFERLQEQADGADAPGRTTAWPVEHYYDRQHHERELTMISRQPIPFAHASQVAEPGDYVADSICGLPIVVIRTTAGQLKAFLNVCRHRGAEIVRQPCGRGLKSFVCPYHAWTYDRDGNLAHIPDQRGSFSDITPEDRGLVELVAQERHGIVWVTPSRNAELCSSQHVEHFLGPDVDADLASYRLGEYDQYKQQSWTCPFNWKCGVEAMLETYHFAALHPTTAALVLMNNVGLYDQFGWHGRAVVPKRGARELAKTRPADLDVRRAATLVYLVFPATCVFVEPDHCHLMQILPTDVEECRVKITHLVERDGPDLRDYWDANIGMFIGAVREDLEVCESMQRGYRAGANRETTFGANEVACHMYRRNVEAALGDVI